MANMRWKVPAALLLACLARAAAPIYLDPKQPVEARVEDLLARMTLEEKVGQMNMPCVYVRQMGGVGFGSRILNAEDIAAKKDACRRFTEGTYVEGLGPGGGFFTLANTVLHEGPRQQALFFNELQKIALEKTRLKIPLLQTEEGTHGLMCSGGTIFPEGPGLGSTWNMDLIREIYSDRRPGGARRRHPPALHAGGGAEPRSAPGPQRGGLQRRPVPLLAHRRVDRARRAGRRRLRARPSRGRIVPLPGTEPAGRAAWSAAPWRSPSACCAKSSCRRGWPASSSAGALGVMATYPAIDGVPTHASERS